MFITSRYHELLDWERWSRPLENGRGYAMLDPLSLDRINTQAPPHWISEDRPLQKGFTYLARLGGRLSLRMAYIQHYEAQDLGDIADGWYESAVASVPFHAIEGAEWTDRDLRLRKEMAD